MTYNPKTVTLKFVMPDGYYTPDEELNQLGIDTLMDILDENGFEYVSVYQ